jgi:membrane protein implicated in regulation of membrane protease activity
MPDAPDSAVTEVTLALLLIDLGLAVVALVIFSLMITRAARFPGLAPLIPALVTLAATGVGALAAVLTKTFSDKESSDQLPFDDEDEDA